MSARIPSCPVGRLACWAAVLLLTASAAYGQPPPTDIPAPLPAFKQPPPPPPPPPPMTPPPPPVVVDPVCPPTAVEQLAEPAYLRAPWLVSGEIGVGTAGMYGNLVPPAGFGRPGFFPIPSARLDAVVSPRVTFGYDLGPLPGRIDLTWEGYFADGQAIVLGYDPLAASLLPAFRAVRDNGPYYLPDLVMRDSPNGNGIVHSRAEVNLVDLTYSAALWRSDRAVLIGKVGGRIGSFFSDDRAEGYGYAQSASNNFVGAGPVVGLRAESATGAGLYGGVDGGALFGRDRQEFCEYDAFRRHPLREASVAGDRAVEFVTGELGWTGRPTWDGRLRWATGVRYTQFFGVGDLGPSRLDFQAFVAFIRLDWRF